MRDIKRVVEIKEGRSWNIHHIVTDEKEIYESLSHDLTVTYDNNCRSLYTVKSDN